MFLRMSVIGAVARVAMELYSDRSSPPESFRISEVPVLIVLRPSFGRGTCPIWLAGLAAGWCPGASALTAPGWSYFRSAGAVCADQWVKVGRRAEAERQGLALRSRPEGQPRQRRRQAHPDRRGGKPPLGPARPARIPRHRSAQRSGESLTDRPDNKHKCPSSVNVQDVVCELRLGANLIVVAMQRPCSAFIVVPGLAYLTYSGVSNMMSSAFEA